MLALVLLLLSSLQAQDPVRNRPPLQKPVFTPLPLGSVKPAGWLERELRTQASGLTGNLEDFWKDVGPTSGWLGGNGESWERGPYYLDGLVPLAYLLDDPKLIARAKKWIEWTLTHQRPDGAIGPEPKRGTYAEEWQATDWWPNMVMLKVLTQYHEATGDARVLPLMTRYFHYHLAHAKEKPLIKWASYRWGEEIISILWLYNRTGDAKLIELAKLLATQQFDWPAHFRDFKYPGKVAKKDASMSSHGVNNAMAIKYAPLWWLVSGQQADRTAITRMFEMLDRHHGQATGMFAADEHYAGLDPSQGTELCAVVEAMYSLELSLGILGDPALGDRLERIAFNAQPATFKSDMWAHQYDQQVNQVMCSRDKSRNWTTNGQDANVFGLEPNFGCCTANMHQGWPKYAAHLWMATEDNGLAAIAYGPSRLTTAINGSKVSITEETEYPFRDSIRLVVSPEKTIAFPLMLRIPAWAEGALVRIGREKPEQAKPGMFHRISRTWKPGDVVEIRFPMKVRHESAYRDSVVVLRGPLLFSLKVGEDWRKLKGDEPHADWEVHPTTPWNYALDPAQSFKVEEKPVGALPFSPEGAPVVLRANGRKLESWKLINGSADTLPQSPVTSSAVEETLTLIPYGSAKLRVTAFPRLR